MSIVVANIFLGLGALGVAFCAFLLARNEMTYRVRTHFIDADELWPNAYDRLPPYSEMCDHPRHWLRWTKRQWIEYVEAA